MNPFERELRKLYQDSGVMADMSFLDRACMGSLGNGLKGLVTFARFNPFNEIHALQLSVFHPQSGEATGMRIAFAEVLQQVDTHEAGDRRPADARLPCLTFFPSRGTLEWENCRPSPGDRAAIAQQTRACLDQLRGAITQEQDVGSAGMQLQSP